MYLSTDQKLVHAKIDVAKNEKGVLQFCDDISHYRLPVLKAIIALVGPNTALPEKCRSCKIKVALEHFKNLKALHF